MVRFFFDELKTKSRWKTGTRSPFELTRIQNPPVGEGVLQEAMDNLRAAWPVFKDAKVSASWAGLIDMTPDGEPVISRVSDVPGLTLATGFSGHGFGTAPAAGQLAADLVMNDTPLVDPSHYRFDRF